MIYDQTNSKIDASKPAAYVRELAATNLLTITRSRVQMRFQPQLE